MRTTTFRGWTLLAVVLTYGAILMGGFTRGAGAGLGCGDAWPLCQGSWFPDWSDSLMTIEWTHRFVAMFAGLAIFGVAAAAWASFRSDRRILSAATIAAVLLPFQAYLGKAVVENELRPALSALHMGVASALFGAVVALAIFAWQRHARATSAERVVSATGGVPASGPRPPPAGRAAVGDYVHLLRPRMHTLLVLAALMAMVVAAGRAVPWPEATIVALGGSAAIGGASAINAYVERDTDQAMERTRSRLRPGGAVPARHALALGLALVFAGVVVMAAFVNLLAATLTLGAAAYYLFVYTVLLKPNTRHNTVLGGIAGAVPPLVGWAAVTDGLGLSAFALAGVVFAWQPAHFWALALHHRHDYARAGLPMLPVVKGPVATRRAILGWTLWTIVAAALLAEPLHLFGAFYLIASATLGLLFLAVALTVRFSADERAPLRMFYSSIAYLGLLFAAMMVDRLAF